MTQPGRNDPCPCGSGKKYKKCCMAKQRAAQAEAARSEPPDTPVRAAIRWLDRRHRDALEEAQERFYALGGADGVDVMGALSGGHAEMAEISCVEWLLADGTLRLDDGEVPVRNLLLAPGGPLFAADELAWMEAFVSRPLGLYEVMDSIPGERLQVSDLLHPEESPVWVEERSASRSLVRWDVLGARLVPWSDGWRLSGAVYPFVRRAVIPELVQDLLRELHQKARNSPEREREILAVRIPEAWLGEVLQPPAGFPELVDAASGEALLFVTDHYRVEDWGRLEEALAGQDDVEGDRRDGWNRFEVVDEDVQRSLLALNPKGKDRLEAFARTRRRADEGRRWLEGLVGDAIEHRTRELTDPQGFLGKSRGPEGGGERSGARAAGRGSDGEGRFGGGPAPAGASGAIPMTTEIMQQIFHAQYRTWADGKIPVLGGKTPRQAVRTRKGREQVIELLKLYELQEELAARREARAPASVQFLWDAVGLDREDVLGRRGR